MSENTEIEWRPIPGYGGFYSASNTGLIRSEQRQVNGKLGSKRTLPQRVLRLNTNGDGYYQVRLCVDPDRFMCKVHSLVMLAFVGPRSEGMEVAHGDGNRLNNLRGNLRYDTPAGNQADKAKHATVIRGTASARSKLSEDQVRAIRLDPRTYREIGRAYGVHHGNISSIKNGTSWGWL